MNTKHSILLFVSILFCTITYGQKIKYAEGQLSEWKSSSEMNLKVPYYRNPKIPWDVNNFADIKSKINNMKGWPKWINGRGEAMDDHFLGYDSKDKLIVNKMKPHFEMFDDRLELSSINSNKKLVIWFADLKNENLRVIKLRKFKDVQENSYLELKNMWFEYNVDWFADWLYAIKYFLYEEPKIKQQNDSIAAVDSIQFNIAVAKYRELKEKPAITEEQRKYIVQANSFAKDKAYGSAIGAYQKVIAANPVAYPAAYYNMALLYAETKDYTLAVRNMKKYLLLVPDAPDARAAQDKIYEWER